MLCACASEPEKNANTEHQLPVEEESSKHIQDEASHYKIAEQAIDENNDSLFRVAAQWFLYSSREPVGFINYANRMALKNESQNGYYYYFLFYDTYFDIETTDTALVNHLFWYLAKSLELGAELDPTGYKNDVFNVEVKDADYYLKNW